MYNYNISIRIIRERITVVEDFVKLEYDMYPYKETTYRSAHIVNALHTSGKTINEIWRELNFNKIKRKGLRVPMRLSWRDMARISRKYKKKFGLKFTPSIIEEEQKVVAFRFIGLIAQNIVWDYDRYHGESIDIDIDTHVKYDYVLLVNKEPFILIDVLDNNPPKNKEAYLYLSLTKCYEEDFYGIFRPTRREGYLYKSLKRIIFNRDSGSHDESRFVTLKNGFPAKKVQA